MFNCLFSLKELFNHNPLSLAVWEEQRNKRCIAPSSPTIYLVRFWTIHGGPDGNFVVKTVKEGSILLECFFLLSPHIWQGLIGLFTSF